MYGEVYGSVGEVYDSEKLKRHIITEVPWIPFMGHVLFSLII